MNELYENLVYIRNLLLAMQRLNEEEGNLQSQVREPVKRQKRTIVVEEQPETKYSGKKVIYVIIGLFLALELFGILSHGYAVRRDMESQQVLEEWDWGYNHPDGEPYPGETEISDAAVYSKAALLAFPAALIQTAIIGAVVITVKRSKATSSKKKVKQEREMLAAYDQKLSAKNAEIQRRNQEIAVEIEGIHNRKYMISQEYQQNVLAWFPKDYGYLSAVDFFINLVENHMVTTIQEAVKEYNTYMYRQETINNQKVMISKQEQLVRLQMIGNMINFANLATNISTNAKVGDIAESSRRTAAATERTAAAAESTASSSASTADTLDRMYRRR